MAKAWLLEVQEPEEQSPTTLGLYTSFTKCRKRIREWRGLPPKSRERVIWKRHSERFYTTEFEDAVRSTSPYAEEGEMETQITRITAARWTVK